VGPVYKDEYKEQCYEDLKLCFCNCIQLAEQLKVDSISLPPISTGVFCFPKDKCAEILFNVIRQNAVRVKNNIENNSEEFLLKEMNCSIIDLPTFTAFVDYYKEYVENNSYFTYEMEDIFEFESFGNN